MAPNSGTGGFAEAAGMAEVFGHARARVSAAQEDPVRAA